ncbi:MAG TPA: sugar-binding protein [Gemmataceae bacterium]|nr:sugar-binding protein [Gemmataceae bacterium]
MQPRWIALLVGFFALLALAEPVRAADKPVVGLIPKAQQSIKMDGKLDDWQGAFVTPVHVGHPDFANRGTEVLFLWDEKNLYIGLRCLDQHPAHFGAKNQIWNGDGVEFYLDTRQGPQLGARAFGPGTLHMFWTPFTGTDIGPQMQVRDLPAFRDFKLRGAQVAGAKTSWGYTAEFKLPWANFPQFTPKPGEDIGIDVEVCSSDGGPRVDRTFVYSSPASVETPAAFGRVRLVDSVQGQSLKPFGAALLPLTIRQSGNYPWLYATAGISPTIAAKIKRIEGTIKDQTGKVRLKSAGSRQTLPGSGIVLWHGSWELFELPAGTYTCEVSAYDNKGELVAAHALPLVQSQAAARRAVRGP